MFKEFRKLGLALSLLLGTEAAAQTITAEQADRAVVELEQLIRGKYVSVELRGPIIGKLEAGRAAGRYAVTTPQDLAGLVTADLQAVSKDGHLSLQWNPDRYASASGREPSAEGPSLAAYLAASAISANHGIGEIRVLDGNVRYMRVTLFHWIPDVTGRQVDAAMQLLKDGEAVILDLRGTPGGASSAVRYFLSHFMAAEEEQLLMTFGPENEPAQSRSLSYLPSGRAKGKLYVLTDRRTGSAAEEFAYHVRHFRLGTLVGARTGGAANNNGLFPVAPGFIASISLLRPVHSVTNTNWEGVGVEPHIEVAPDKALQAAYLNALEGIAERAPEGERRRAVWRMERERAALHPYTPNRQKFPDYVGDYGVRRIWLQDGDLMYQRAEGPQVKLLPFAEDVFTLGVGPAARLRFHRDGAGRATAIEILFEDRETERAERTGNGRGRASHRRTDS